MIDGVVRKSTLSDAYLYRLENSRRQHGSVPVQKSHSQRSRQQLQVKAQGHRALRELGYNPNVHSWRHSGVKAGGVRESEGKVRWVTWLFPVFMAQT